MAQPDDLLGLGFKVEAANGFQVSRASYLDYRDLRERVQAFDGIAAYDYETVGLSVRAGDPARVRFATFISDNFFGVLGVPLALGRAFRPDEAGGGTPARVVILTDALWRADFEADPTAIGRVMRIGGRDFTVVGVAPRSFSGLHQFVREAVFLPMGALPQIVDAYGDDVLQTRHARVFNLKARLREGVTIGQARAELATIAEALERAYPESNTDRRLVAQTELAYKFEQRPLDAALIVLLLALSVAVLGVACANVAGLLASRAPVRAREMSLRMAIGAGRGRLVRQLLTETLVIALAGGVAGLAVAQLGIAVLRGIQFPSDIIAPPVLARQMWPDGDPIGRTLQIIDQGGRWVTVVGVARRTTMQFPGERPQNAIYFPYVQQPRGQVVILAHTEGPSASVVEALRAVAMPLITSLCLHFETEINHPALMFVAVDLDLERIRRLPADQQGELRPMAEAVVKARRDQIATYQRNGSHVRVVLMRRASHYLFVDRAREVAAEMIAFPQGPDR